MPKPVFARWPDSLIESGLLEKNSVRINEAQMSWQMLFQKATVLAEDLNAYKFCFIDANQQLDSLISFIALSMLEDCHLIWGNPDIARLELERVTHCIYAVRNTDLLGHVNTDRTFYGSLTSGSSAKAKIAMGYADQLANIGQFYHNALYERSLGKNRNEGLIASCLPMEYSASLMMAIFPAWFSGRNLCFFEATQWRYILERAAIEPTTVLLAPCMLATACAYVQGDSFRHSITFLTTAGFLSQERVTLVKEKFPLARFEVSYGSTETGIITLGEFLEEKASVGKPLFGKPVWLRDLNEQNIGTIVTSGIGNRQFYLHSGEAIEHADGVVSNLDYGHFDLDGNLYLDGRIDDAVKINGSLFYIKETERHLLQLKGVEDVRVTVQRTGVGSDFIEAVVITNLRKEELIEHCNKLVKELQPKSYTIYETSTEIYSDRGKMKEVNPA